MISYNRAIKVTSTYNKIVGTNQIIIPALTVNKSTANDLDNSLYKISNNTEVYVQDKYQNIITKALRLRYYDTQTKGSENDRIVRALKEIYSENYSDILLSMYYESEVFVSNFSREIFSDLLGEDKRPLINAILAIISYETGSVDHFISDNIEKSSLMLILKIALFDNAGNLFDNHYPELYLAWLESYDAKELFGKKTYKKITTSCPVNVSLFFYGVWNCNFNTSHCASRNFFECSATSKILDFIFVIFQKVIQEHIISILIWNNTLKSLISTYFLFSNCDISDWCSGRKQNSMCRHKLCRTTI